LTEVDPTRQVRIAVCVIVSALVALGIVMIYSSSAVYADQQFGDHLFFLKRHLLACVLGLGVAFMVMMLDYRRLEAVGLPIAIATLLVLLAVKLPFGTYEAGGARRWFEIAGFLFQPGEFAKVALVIYTATLLPRVDLSMGVQKKNLVMLSVIPVCMMMLVLVQPDFGTAATLGMLFLALLFAAGIPRKYFLIMMAIGLVGLLLAVVLEPYRMQRVVSFLAPWKDPRGAGFQLWQSFLAIGSGGFGGVGLGQSQQKLFYLPASHNDFIFSIIAEELGFLGASFVIALFTGFIFYGFRIVNRCSNRFGQMLGLGLVMIIGMEAAINIGVNLGALPTKGLALPFVSYGGSSFVVKMLCVGLLLNLSRDAHANDAGS
jgi:cell division protein FtsW